MESKLKTEVFFCSAASRYFKEQLAGTAANSNAFILIEHSNPFPEKIINAHLDKDWLRSVQQFAKTVRGKVLLIRNKKTNFKDCKISFVDCNASKYFTLQTSIEAITSIRLEEHVHSPETKWQTDPFFLICTNGKKDKCCAKFGFPVFKFFESFNADVNVWECTHVGGDRFAANVVAMPFGIYYGHVAVEDVGHIMVRTLLRKIYKNKFRGLSRRSFYEQAIECHLREYLQNYDIDFEIHTKLLHHEGNHYSVDVTTSNNGHYIVDIERIKIPYPHLLTCSSKKQEDLSKFTLSRIQKIGA
ncbi:sucrase ferredoxin [Niabella insulamsoli]|uniref:sucrase ferredoxin n=1 Tax=Niabella insulamsoli TaxID=3144874 RepID=UPI0031FD4BF2